MDHDVPLVAAMLGVLKAGQTIVVLNPGDPPGRLDRIRRQVEPWAALIDARHRDLAQRAGFSRILETPNSPRGPVPEASGGAIEPDDLAAVMYTSGSTGRPKGVMHTHRTLLHTALRHALGLGLRTDDRVALLASPSGGHGMGTTWMTLLTGATLCPFPVMDRGVAGLPGWLIEQRISVLGLSASLFRRLIVSLNGEAFPDLRLVRLGSEQVRRADFDACRGLLGSECRFANVFSLTEAGGLAHCVFPAGEQLRPGPLPVGHAAQGVEILLLDEHGEPVPAGELGEIVVRSRHLTPGYWHDQPLTAARFSAERAGQRTLRTGDLGRLDEDGRLVVAGRGDAQVKIRGYRVELSEVEGALRALQEVESAAARPEPTRHGDSRLTAYVVPRPGRLPTPAALREALRATLSEASIPTAFAFIDELPLNAHGKVDRERLAGISPTPSAAGAEYAEPLGELERKLARIWAGALELERVGRDDDFFDVGGDSLAAAEIGAGINEEFGVELDMRAFARHPTVAGMAQLVSRLRVRRGAEGPRIERVPRDRPISCSFAQERIWQFASGPERSAGYTVASVSSLHGPIDLEALRAALEHVASCHEPLRTTFAERDGVPFQIVHPRGTIETPVTDVSGSHDPEWGARELLRKRAAEPFDLSTGPLLRFQLVRIGEGDYRLLRVTHHLTSDRRSWQIFFRELVPAYEAIRRGAPPPPNRPGRLQYADFAAWQRRALRPDGPRYREQVAWWRHALGPTPAPMELPFARQSPASGLPPEEGSISWGIDPAVGGTLDLLGREQGATHYTVRLALFSALLAFETGRRKVTIGAYVDTRRLPETRSMFGYFSNLLTLILPFDPGATLRGWLAKVRFILAEAMARSDLPYQLVCDELLACGQVPPEINAIFAVRYPMPHLPFGKAEQIPPSPSLITMPWGFSFNVDQQEESNRCRVDFDAHLYDPSEVRRFIDRYAGLAEVAGGSPDRPLGDLYPGLR
jgi:amino acid adenylation domain-containing protein